MKLWINRAKGEYCGGLAVIAADSVEEAHSVLLMYSQFYGEWYDVNNWECVENAYINTEKPYLIAEDSHEG